MSRTMKLGGLERPKDERDFLLGSVQAPVAIPYPFAPDLSWLVKNWQGETPYCGAHGASHFQAVLEHILVPGINQHFTPRYIWIKIKQIDGYPLESGTDMRSIFKTLQNNGADDYEPLENDVTLSLTAYANPSVVTADMDTNAAAKKITSYAFGSTDFNSLCQHIYQNKAVLLLIKVDDGFWGTANPVFTSPDDGHFVVAYGYDLTGILIIDSADKDFPLKKILKQYITPKFIIESGTALDIPPAILQQSVSVAEAVVAAPEIAPQEKILDLTAIFNFLKSLFVLKVGSTSEPMNTKPWYTSKTLWFNGVTIIVAVATFFGWTLNQDLFNNVTGFLVAISPVVNIGLRFFTTKPIASPVTQ